MRVQGAPQMQSSRQAEQTLARRRYLLQSELENTLGDRMNSRVTTAGRDKVTESPSTELGEETCQEASDQLAQEA